MFFFQNLTAELFLLESPDDSYFPKSGGSTFLKTVGSHFSEICGNKITAYTQNFGRSSRRTCLMCGKGKFTLIGKATQLNYNGNNIFWSLS